VDYRQQNSFIGIRNLGSTCYANSLLQQFFHNRRIREFIHRLPIEIDKQLDSMSGNGVLKELMLLFGQLTLNKSSQADLSGFTCKFTGFDGTPINVKVQQDVNEFFNLLLDCLERELAALDLPNKADAFKTELGGSFLNEITSMDPQYDYSTSNEEHFNTITIDVKGVHSMHN
jgi:ubiquitin C-terminal hydrolase